MPDTLRELIAYLIIGAIVLGVATFWLATRKSRREKALRRRGIKSHNRTA